MLYTRTSPSRGPFLTLCLGISAALCTCACFGQMRSKTVESPNIIILLADDMGYADPACFGGTAVKTPNLDRLAASGTRLTNFYAASAVCSPTRAAVLTGKYPLRFNFRQHLKDDEGHLPRKAVTLAQRLKQAGYSTAHVGKWHLGGLHLQHAGDRAQSIPGPHEHGFDHYLCQIEEQPLRGMLGRERLLYRQGGSCLLRNEKRVGTDDPYHNMHFTDINGKESVRLIEHLHGQGRPFFLNCWWLVPHTPYEPAPEPFWSRTAAPDISHDQHCFRSMVAHMDHHVGGILDQLDALSIRDNTFVFFTSDNGGAYEADIGPYSGGKTDLHEGGLRVPAIVSWPRRIPAAHTTPQFGHSTDIFPTLCASAGIPIPSGIDGQNLLPHLTGDALLPERGTVFWQMDLYRHLQRHKPKPKPFSKEIARRGKWKLLCSDGRPKELFDLDQDPLERTNLLAKYPGIVKTLTRELRRFLREPRLSPYANDRL
jgi:arylsulfatase A